MRCQFLPNYAMETAPGTGKPAHVGLGFAEPVANRTARVHAANNLETKLI